MTTLTTERLLLRPLTMDDLEPLHAAVYGDPAVTWDGSTLSLEQARPRLQGKVDHVQQHGFGMGAVLERESGTLLGFAGLQHLEGSDDVEVGYYLSRASWGRGYGTEIARASVEHGFAQLHLPRIWAVVRPENSASQKVLAKVGLRPHHEAEHYGAHVQVWVVDAPPR